VGAWDLEEKGEKGGKPVKIMTMAQGLALMGREGWMLMEGKLARGCQG